MTYKGINYGHHWSDATYNGVIAQQELRDIWQAGYRIVRVAMPEWPKTGFLGTIIWCQDIVGRALGIGFYVLWGVVHTRPVVTAANFASSCAYIRDTLAPWAQSLGTSQFRLTLGNEEELHLDNTTITAATFMSGIKALATSVQTVYSFGEIDYVTDATRRSAWGMAGIGDLDRIGWNIYYFWEPTRDFRDSVQYAATTFGASHTYIAEWSTEDGFEDATGYGAADAEERWAENLRRRQEIIDTAGLQHCVFTYAGGSFGVDQAKWPLKKADGTFHKAWYRLAGIRPLAASRTASSHPRHTRAYGAGRSRAGIDAA